MSASRHPLLFAAVLAVSCLAAPASAVEAPWETHPVFSDRQYEVRLLVRSPASLADDAWLALEFVNKTDFPVELKHVAASTNRRDFDLATGKPLASGSLFSGQTDLFSEHPPRPRGEIYRKLAPRQTLRCERMPSDYSAALLGLPHPNGRRVEAELRIQVDPFFKDARIVPFAFEWRHPDDAGFKRTEARLRRLMAERDPTVSAQYLTGALLEVQRIRQEISVDELLAAIERRYHEPQEIKRAYLLRAVDRHYPKDPRVTEFYRRQLAAGQVAAVHDLDKMPAVWRGDFVDGIVRMVERDPARNRFMLRVLDRNAVDWATGPEVRRRLFDALRATYADVPDDPREAGDDTVGRWRYMVEELRQTRDARVVPLLTLGLDDKRKLIKDEKLRSSGFGQRPPPQRVCDVALEQLLTVLDGTPEDAYAETPLGNRNGVVPKAATPAEAITIRDRLIATLKARLAERAKPAK